MSRKVNTFAAVVTQPLNIHNFVVTIPEADNTSLIVESTAFPAEQLQEMILHFQGEEIHYPTIPKNSHAWNVKVPEADSGVIRRELEALKQKIYDQLSGIVTPQVWSNVNVYARDLAGNLVFHVILHGVWIVGRNDVQLSNTDPSQSWKWDYQFRFQWIEDADDGNTGTPDPSVNS